MNNIGHFKQLVESMERRALGEDWGSSDWYPVLKGMEEYIEAKGMSPENVEFAAQHQAEFYYSDMGYESPEAAVESIVGAWLRMSEQGKAWSKMFAPVTEDNEETLGAPQLTYDFEWDGDDIIIHTMDGEPVAEMTVDNFAEMVRVFLKIMRNRPGK